MKVTIKKSSAHGNLNAPPSKSDAHRLIICAAMANGKSVISNFGKNDDICATVRCLEAMGADISEQNDDIIVSSPTNSASFRTFDCGESGSTLRFLIPISLIFGGGNFIGSKRLMERGVGIYKDILSKNCKITQDERGIHVAGKIESGVYEIPGNISSQFISGMLFALPMLSGDSVIKITNGFESRAYVDMTIETLKKSGIRIDRRSDTEIAVPGWQKYLPINERVEGDWSNAAFLLALGSLGGDVNVSGLKNDSLQGDKVCKDIISRLEHPNETIDLSNCPDLAPIMFALAAAKHGAVFTGTKRLKIKESDRAAVMAEELKKFGAAVICEDNKVTVEKCDIHAPTEELFGHNDHRIIMALSIILTKTGGTINGAEAVKKSYPNFFDTLCKAGVDLTYEN